jgi:starvation-inducible DNA-binding protein
MDDVKENLVEGMRVTLGSAFALYVMTHGYHWNVTGPDFFQIHKMLDDQYNDIWASLDDIAEHLRALDAFAPQSMERFLELSVIPSSGPAPINSKDMLLILVKANEALIDVMTHTLHQAEEADEQGIVNFLGGRIETHQKHRWMLRASTRS